MEMNKSMYIEICSKKYNSSNCPDYLYANDKTLYENYENNEYLGRFYDRYKFHVVKYKIQKDCILFQLNKKDIYCNKSNSKTFLGRIILVKYVNENTYTIKV